MNRRYDNFDCDVAAKLGICCTIDLAHSARADGAYYAIWSEAVART